jgi:TldD protein
VHVRLRGWLGVLIAVFAVTGHAHASTSPVLEAMQTELTRSMQVLRGEAQPPYFLSYEVTDSDQAEVVASFGAITASERERQRLLRVDLRVGDYTLDNTHELRDDPFGGMMDRLSFVPLPIEDNPAAIRSVLWIQTDKAFKRAQEKYTKAQTQVQVKVEEEDRSDDLSHERPETAIEELPAFDLDRAPWEQKLKRYTAPFAQYGDIYQADAQLAAVREIRWFVSSEGARIQTSRVAYRLLISAVTKADDGMELPRHESYFAFTPEGLPDDATVLAAVERMIADLQALRVAPIVDPYTGPAILTGRASSVFFHEIFGHRVEGHRQRSEEEGQTFKKMVGQRVLPESFSVIFDPTLREASGTDLAGSFAFDDEGVRAQRVVVVNHGILERFLMSRKPIAGFPNSNGHGRCQPGFSPVSRQSNLIVQVDDPVSRDELKVMLLERIQAEGKPFGLIFDDIIGGFTMTGRTTPNAFNVIPVMVYRIFPDGREELVRGVDLIGTPLTAFSQIAAGDDQPAIFNGTCGAESGGVPTAAVSPGILVAQIEVQKKEKSQDRPPLLSPPQGGSLGW